MKSIDEVRVGSVVRIIADEGALRIRMNRTAPGADGEPVEYVSGHAGKEGEICKTVNLNKNAKVEFRKGGTCLFPWDVLMVYSEVKHKEAVAARAAVGLPPTASDGELQERKEAKHKFPKVDALGLTEDIEKVVRQLHRLGVSTEDDLKLLTKEEIPKLDVAPVSKTKIENLAKSLGAFKATGSGEELVPWLRHIGIAEESIDDVLGQFTKPEFGVTTLKMLFALDEEDVDDIVKTMPLGQRKLIKKSIEVEKFDQKKQ